MAETHNNIARIKAHSRRLAVFLGSEPRRAETRFCARKNGDSSSTCKSTRRASSSSSRGGALGGYNSSCMMVEPLFRAIKSGQLSRGIAELFHYSRNSRIEIDQKLRDLHRWEPDWIRPLECYTIPELPSFPFDDRRPSVVGTPLPGFTGMVVVPGWI